MAGIKRKGKYSCFIGTDSGLLKGELLRFFLVVIIKKLMLKCAS